MTRGGGPGEDAPPDRKGETRPVQEGGECTPAAGLLPTAGRRALSEEGTGQRPPRGGQDT